MADYESIILDTEEKSAVKKPIEENFQSLKAVIVSSAHVVNDTYAGFIAPLLPFLIERMSLLKVEAGVFMLLYNGVSVLQPVIGHMGDRTNLRKYAILMPAITGIVLSLLGIVPTFYLGLLLCLIGGFSSASMHAILPSLVAKLSGNHVGKGMSIWLVGGEIGFMMGPLLIASVISLFGIKATPWLMVPGIAVSIWFKYSPQRYAPP